MVLNFLIHKQTTQHKTKKGKIKIIKKKSITKKSHKILTEIYASDYKMQHRNKNSKPFVGPIAVPLKINIQKSKYRFITLHHWRLKILWGNSFIPLRSIFYDCLNYKTDVNLIDWTKMMNFEGGGEMDDF